MNEEWNLRVKITYLPEVKKRLIKEVYVKPGKRGAFDKIQSIPEVLNPSKILTFANLFHDICRQPLPLKIKGLHLNTS